MSESEVENLKKEVATLREELKQCRSGIENIHDAVENGEPVTLHTEDGETAKIVPQKKTDVPAQPAV